MLLQDKIVLITGASKGIGRAIAETFSAQGAKLILLSRDLNALEELKKNLSHPDEHLIFQADVRDQSSLKKVFDELHEKKLFIDCLVNNAGIMKDATLQVVKLELITDVYQTNVYGTIFTSQFALKSFLRKRGGSIINLTSIIGTKGNSGQSIYSSSKAAVVGFTQSLSKELAPLNVRVNAIAPGFIDTDLNKGIDEKIYEKTMHSIGMRRPGKASEVANVALFLASDLSHYVTGQIIGVDGGMII